MTSGATTRSVMPSQPEADALFAEIARLNPDLISLTDKAFAEAAMHPAAQAREAAAISLGEAVTPKPDWLNTIVKNATNVWHEEPSHAQRVGGAEVRPRSPEVDALNAQTVAIYADRQPDIRTLAVRRGTPDFSQEQFTLAA